MHHLPQAMSTRRRSTRIQPSRRAPVSGQVVETTLLTALLILLWSVAMGALIHFAITYSALPK